MTSPLRFGYHIDREYVVPFYQRFQYVYGVFILGIHSTVFYLLIFHTKPWARAVRASYLLNQGQMLAHDVWTCFLFRGYTLLPYPAIFCSDPLCTAIGGYNSMTVEDVFMVHSICIFLFMLLMVHQQIIPRTSKLRFPRW
ncbi:hypothetical protein PENTCL1PPCAC_15479, partial [Pristionchus entomophagus]